MQGLGALTADEMFHACEVMGSGDVAAALRHQDVPPAVKAALRSLGLCMANVLGTNAHRITLRHIVSGYRLLFGAPLVFTTVNVPDTKMPVMRLLYSGKTVAEWKLLEEDDPRIGSSELMRRVVADDPVAQAIVSDLMFKLFIKHVLGALPSGHRGFADGFVSDLRPSLFGAAQAYFAPLESQGRGGLHVHMSVWINSWLKARVLDCLKGADGSVQEELKQRILDFREAVLEKVASVQFDSVEEFGRQLGLEGEEALLPLPLSKALRYRLSVEGKPERSDLLVEPPSKLMLKSKYKKHPFVESEKPAAELKHELEYPEKSFWNPKAQTATPCQEGPRRQQECVELQEADPRLAVDVSVRQPQWRRLPPYRSSRARKGLARVVGVGDGLLEARRYARAFGRDARALYARHHLHRCMETCYKHSGGGKPGDKNRICRFGFYHIFESICFKRRWPNHV
jgi:hypothetical protein